MNPQTGLLFIDFSTGDVLHLAGKAEILWDHPKRERFTGAQLLWRVTVTGGPFPPAALPRRWEEPSYPLPLARRGSWDAVAASGALDLGSPE